MVSLPVHQPDCRHRAALRAVLGLVVSLAFSDWVAAGQLDDWQWRNPLLGPNRLFSVAGVGHRFTAVGLGGAVVVSTNGTYWTAASPAVPEPQDLYGVACGLGLTVAVGGEGTIFVGDGTTWTRADTGLAALLNAVAFGAGRWVAVGDADENGNATILSSMDGYQWTPAVVDTPGVLTAVTHAAGRFVAVGEAGLILTSPDGDLWVPMNSGTAAHLNGVTYGQGRFLAVGLGAILTSPDGSVWSSPVASMPHDLYAATAYGTNFIAVGAGRVLVSGDGTNWVHHELGRNPTDLWGVAAGDDLLVAVGSEWPAPTQVAGLVMTSVDTAVWTARTGGVQDQAYYGVVWRPGTFVAVGLQSQTPTLAALSVSSAGEGWTRAGLAVDGSLSGVVEGLGTFVAVGSYTNPAAGQMQGRILTSSDGRGWVDRTPPEVAPLLAVAHGGDRFVAVGLTNVWVSKDALLWVQPSSRTATNLQAITFGNGLFVGVGQRGTIQTSTDGELWTTRVPSTPTSRALRGVAFGNNRFVTVGNVGTIIVSDDGLDWTSVDSGTTDIFYAVAHGNGQFVAVGFASTTTGFSALWTSPDGRTWTQRTPPSTQTLRAVTYGNGTFLAVGEYGVILQSGLATDWMFARAIGWQPGGFAVSLQAAPGTAFRLQASTNLETGAWVDLLGFTSTASMTSLVDTSAMAFPRRFYRVVSP